MIHTFAELGLSEKMLASVEQLGYKEPTPVQTRAIPLVLEGRDIVAAAKTGTGKTAAFALPAIDRIGYSQKEQNPKILVITPTRELAQQIGEVFSVISRVSQHRIATLVGGVSYEPQKARLKKGTDVVIATPGRLIDLMQQESVSLSSLEVLVLDEADRMLDMGFWPSIKKIVAQVPDRRQTLMFSATIDKSIEEQSRNLLKNPAYVEIAHKGETADTVDQYLIRVPQAAKADLLKAVLDEKGAHRVIVFTRTRSRADSNTRRLKRAGFSAEAIHSDRTQAQRRRALDNFMQGKTGVLVATDVLARGIDIDEVDYVINFDLPNQAEDYIHRIGRTGRAGEKGFSVSFVSPDQESWLKNIKKLIKTEIPEMKIDSFSAEEAEAKAAERATAHAARKDPELALAVKEQRKKEKRRAAAAASSSSDTKKAPRKKTQPHDKQRQAQKACSKDAPRAGKNNAQDSRQYSKSEKNGTDMRPGRAHRAAVTKRRKRR